MRKGERERSYSLKRLRLPNQLSALDVVGSVSGPSKPPPPSPPLPPNPPPGFSFSSTSCLVSCASGSGYSFTSSACVPCPPRTLSPTLGQGPCTSCAANTFNPDSSALTCAACPDTAFSPLLHHPLLPFHCELRSHRLRHAPHNLLPRRPLQRNLQQRVRAEHRELHRLPRRFHRPRASSSTAISSPSPPRPYTPGLAAGAKTAFVLDAFFFALEFPSVLSCTLDGNAERRHMYASTGSGTLAITGIVFKDGEETGSGGSIYFSSGMLVLITSAFTDNISSSDRGAIFVSGTTASVSIYTSRFTPASPSPVVASNPPSPPPAPPPRPPPPLTRKQISSTVLRKIPSPAPPPTRQRLASHRPSTSVLRFGTPRILSGPCVQCAFGYSDPAPSSACAPCLLSQISSADFTACASCPSTPHSPLSDRSACYLSNAPTSLLFHFIVSAGNTLLPAGETLTVTPGVNDPSLNFGCCGAPISHARADARVRGAYVE